MYTYERYNFRMLPLLLGLMGIIFLIHAEYTGALVSLAIGGLFFVSFQGVHIDPVSRRYMRYDRFIGFRIGQWVPLPRPCYVTIVRINLSSLRRIPSPLVLPDDKQKARAYKVNLVVDGDIRYIPICRGPLEEMREEALKLGRHLQIRVLDYSTHEKKWIL